ncbi:DUF6879 family protein [Streptantibioticus ferralitis]|uniref:DUF6879 domain-containing protein n=1 Tax=Streptantibioticus ferralitis TaxID=236510 RepID=A0ABT5YWC9_9ACTN|nr:DUF6879 family protein [Streptantibioticus ferralitis]MDF2255778.1 hypothetical protein [Streptantibioticus ferralitis]
MARRLRFIGTNSGDNGCPTLYEDMHTGEVLVQGRKVTNPEDITQLRNVEEDEGLVVVPRQLLLDFAPKEAERAREIIPWEQFDSMFNTFEHTAWRLETRRRYKSDEQSETYRRFVRGEDPDWDMNHPWLVARREGAAQGKRFERVRIVDNPPTVGQRYLLNNARRNIQAGEDIRNMWRQDAEKLRLPEEDFWLFDSRVMAVLLFDDDDDCDKVELITDPRRVLLACQARDAAWHHATPNREFIAQVPSDV